MTVEEIQKVLDNCSDPETVIRVKFQPQGETKIEELFACSLKFFEPEEKRDSEAILSMLGTDHSIIMLHIYLIKSLKIMPRDEISDLVRMAERILGRKLNRKLVFSSGKIVGILNQFKRISEETE